MSLLSIGMTALNAAQAGLTTTGHNISNASTTGYNRQVIVQTTMDPQYSGSGFFGRGVQVSDVQRVYSQFLSNQVLSANTAHSNYETYNNEISQIDNLLADDSAGLSPAIQDVFSSIEQVSSDPASVPARQAMLSSSSALVDRFHALNERLSEIRDGVNSQLKGSVDTVNALSKQIADLNQHIREIETAGGSQANDLRDQRDQLISQLNEQVKVSTQTQSDGSINVFFGSGQPLVLGSSTYQLSMQPSASNPEDLQVYSTLGTASIPIPDDLVTGGVMGGLLSFRNDALNTATNELGRLAVTITENFNSQNALGQDLDGNLGGLYFKDISPDVSGTTRAGLSISVNYDAATINHLTTADYTLSFDGTNYTLNGSDGSSHTYAASALPITQDGIQINVTGAAAGDTWQILPTRKAASNMEMAIQDVRKIAAAAPLSVSADTGNSGTGKIGSAAATATTGIGSPPSFNPISVTFNSSTNTFSAYDSTGAAITLSGGGAYDPIQDAAGKTFTTTSPAFQFTISGSPSNGDVFKIGLNTTGVSDNRNILAMGQLQSTKTMLNGGATYESAYSQLVSDVGTMSRNSQIAMDAQQTLLDQATSSQQSLSGVNLDEEASNLLRYQQAYQAAAKVMNTASKLFDEILNITS